MTKGKAVWYSHKTDEGWCNEADVIKRTAKAEETAESTAQDDTGPSGDEKQTVDRDPETIDSITGLQAALKKDFGLDNAGQLRELGITDWNDLIEKPSEAYIKVAAVMV